MNITVISEVEEELVTGDQRHCGFDDTKEGWLNEQPFEYFDGGIPTPSGETGMENILTGDGISPPWNSDQNSRYVELVLVVDTRLYIQFGRRTQAIHDICNQIAKKINSIYLPLNIYVFLVGVVIWRDYDKIQLDLDADLTLQRFLHYRKQVLLNNIPNDNAQLLTGVHFDKGVVGKALKGPICTKDFSGTHIILYVCLSSIRVSLSYHETSFPERKTKSVVRITSLELGEIALPLYNLSVFLSSGSIINLFGLGVSHFNNKRLQMTQ